MWLKSPLMVPSLNKAGFDWKVLVTVNPPHVWDDAEPETLSYHMLVVEEAGTKTEVVIEGKEVAVIVAEAHGLM